MRSILIDRFGDGFWREPIEDVSGDIEEISQTEGNRLPSPRRRCLFPAIVRFARSSAFRPGNSACGLRAMQHPQLVMGRMWTDRSPIVDVAQVIDLVWVAWSLEMVALIRAGLSAPQSSMSLKKTCTANLSKLRCGIGSTGEPRSGSSVKSDQSLGLR